MVAKTGAIRLGVAAMLASAAVAGTLLSAGVAAAQTSEDDYLASLASDGYVDGSSTGLLKLGYAYCQRLSNAVDNGATDTQAEDFADQPLTNQGFDDLSLFSLALAAEKYLCPDVL